MKRGKYNTANRSWASSVKNQALANYLTMKKFSFNEEMAKKWWFSTHACFGHRSVADLFEEGRVAEVIEHLKRELGE